MCFSDGAADPEPHSGSLRLGGEKRFKDLSRLLRRDSYSSIADRNHNFVVLSGLRVDGELTRPIHISHSIDTVNDAIHQSLLQLQSIPHDMGGTVHQVGPDRYRVPGRFTAQQEHHLA